MIYVVTIKKDKKDIKLALCNSAFGSFFYEIKKKGILGKLDFEYALENEIGFNDKFYKVKKIHYYCWDDKKNKIPKLIETLFKIYGENNLKLFKHLFTSCEYRKDYWDSIVDRFNKHKLLYNGKGTIYKGYRGALKNTPCYGWTTNYNTATCFGDNVVKIENADYKIIGGSEFEVIYLPKSTDIREEF